MSATSPQATSSSERTSVETVDDITWITMDDGKVNVMSTAMLEELDSRLQEAAGQGRVTVLEGRPGIFSAGFNLKVIQEGPEAARQMVQAGIRVLLTMLEHPHPIITACTGHAYPMGAFLMLCADVRYGIAGDWKIGLNEVAIGITVPHFALALARHRLTPPGFARIPTGTMSGPEAASLVGYLDYVVKAEALHDEVSTMARSLLSIHLKDYKATKARVNRQVIEAIRSSPELSTAG